MSAPTTIPTIPLTHGAALPAIGLGTWPMDDAEAARAVATAVEAGYRLVDTAENYRNEAGVGQGLRDAGVPREDVFVTTKLNRQWHSVEGVRTAWENSVRRLGLDYLDLFLIHWPNPDQGAYPQAWEGWPRCSMRARCARSACPTSSPHTWSASWRRPA
ncbi:aldo/keto reductase [Xylanimonas ulmi]|uniref:aldo/keto reductase n=1 Tax=Xylanimonas ulmi TaxID=228973 RepID=UPI0026D75541